MCIGFQSIEKTGSLCTKKARDRKKYDELFSNIDNLKIPEIHNSVDHVYHLYPLQIDFNKLSLNKTEFFEKMKQVGINLQVHYIPVHLQPFYKRNYGFKLGDYPIAEKFYDRVVSIPLYPSLNDADVQKVIGDIKHFIKSR